jgi:hypothetical protein
MGWSNNYSRLQGPPRNRRFFILEGFENAARGIAGTLRFSLQSQIGSLFKHRLIRNSTLSHQSILKKSPNRGKWRVAIQVLMTFLVINVKRMTRLLQLQAQEVELLEQGNKEKSGLTIISTFSEISSESLDRVNVTEQAYPVSNSILGTSQIWQMIKAQYVCPCICHVRPYFSSIASNVEHGSHTRTVDTSISDSLETRLIKLPKNMRTD